MGLLSIFDSLYYSYAKRRQDTKPVSGYHLAGNRVYYNAGYSHGPAFEVVGADVRSFEKLSSRSSESNYAKDRSHVYFNGRVIKGADPETFVRLRTFFSKDARFIYYNDAQLSRDPEHFVFIDDSVQKDRKHVYRGGWIISDDPEHFQFIHALDGISYYRDKKGVLANSTRLPGAQAASFKPMRFGYSRDAERVYQVDGMVAKVVEGALPAGFHVYNAYYSHDREQVFWRGKPLPGADPATFAILNEEENANSSQPYHLEAFISKMNTSALLTSKSLQPRARKTMVFG